MNTPTNRHAGNTVNNVEYLYSLLTTPLKRNGFFRACLHESRQENAIFILMMQQFHQDPTSKTKADFIYNTSFVTKNVSVGGGEVVTKKQRVLSGIARVFRQVSDESDEYKRFTVEMNFYGPTVPKALADYAAGKYAEAFAAAEKVIGKNILEQRYQQTKHLTEVIDTYTLSQPIATKCTRTLRRDLVLAGFSPSSMGLY